MADDIGFARKRLVTPKSVYTGLIDILEYSEVNLKDVAGFEVSVPSMALSSLLHFNIHTFFLSLSVFVDCAHEKGRVDRIQHHLVPSYRCRQGGRQSRSEARRAGCEPDRGGEHF